MKMVFLRGSIPPASEHPEKLLYDTMENCEDMWTQLFHALVHQMGATGELVYQGGDRVKVLGGFSERWVPSIANYRPEAEPDIIMCRGGFDYYDSFLRQYPKAKRIYYGAGRRFFPESGFKEYDLFLTDDPRQADRVRKKTSAPVAMLVKPAASLFCHVDVERKFDVCFTANFTRNPTKRFDTLMMSLANRGLRVLAIGNIEKTHKDMARSLNLDIEFRPWVLRKDLPSQISECGVGVCSSGKDDSCPRVIPEFLACGLPVVVADDLSLWHEKYITPETGISVPCEKIGEAVESVLNSGNYSPREYYERELSLSVAADGLAEEIRRLI